MDRDFERLPCRLTPAPAGCGGRRPVPRVASVRTGRRCGDPSAKCRRLRRRQLPVRRAARFRQTRITAAMRSRAYSGGSSRLAAGIPERCARACGSAGGMRRPVDRRVIARIAPQSASASVRPQRQSQICPFPLQPVPRLWGCPRSPASLVPAAGARQSGMRRSERCIGVRAARRLTTGGRRPQLGAGQPVRCGSGGCAAKYEGSVAE